MLENTITVADSNSFFSPEEILPIAQEKQIFKDDLENSSNLLWACMLCVLIWTALSRQC